MKRIKNFGWLSAEDIVRIILSFVMMALIARHLGPSDYGALSYIFGVIGLLMPLTSVGLDMITLRQFVADPENANGTLGSALVIRVTGAMFAIVLAVIFIAAFGGPNGVSFGLAAVASSVLFFQSLTIFDAYLKANEMMVWLAVPRTIVRIIVALVTVWLVVVGGVLSGFVALRVFEAGMMAMAVIGAYAFVTGTLRFQIDLTKVRAMLREGTPLFLSALAVMVYMRIDQVMLGLLATGEALGQYSVAVKVSESVFFVPMALQAAFYPGLVRLKEQAPERWHEDLQHYYDIAALAMLGLVLFVTVFATIALSPLLGRSFEPAIQIVWILCFSIPFVGLGIARTTYLTIKGWLWTSPLTTMLGAAVNVCLNFYFIPAWGAGGAAAATVISYWLAAHGTCFLLPWLRPVGWELTKSLNPFGAACRINARWQQQRQARVLS